MQITLTESHEGPHSVVTARATIPMIYSVSVPFMDYSTHRVEVNAYLVEKLAHGMTDNSRHADVICSLIREAISDAAPSGVVSRFSQLERDVRDYLLSEQAPAFRQRRDELRAAMPQALRPMTLNGSRPFRRFD